MSSLSRSTPISTPATSSGPPPVARHGVGIWVITAIACVAQFMVVLDTAIVNVALPSMKASLHLSTSSQQWVVDAYLLTFGGLLLFGARAGDLFGRRRVLQFGLIVFTLASLAGGLAPSGTVLLIARAAQGVGAAALAPASLSLIMAGHADASDRARALGLWSMAAASAASIGVVLGGVLTQALDWRYVLFVNVPVGVALSVAAARGLVPGVKAHVDAKLDLPGAFTATVGLSSAVYGISQATQYGWGSTRVLIALIAAVVLLSAFVAVELRTAQPLVRLGIFTAPNLTPATLSMLGLGTAMTASLFFLTLYLQQILGYGALHAGLCLLPMAAVLGVGSFVARALMSRGIRGLPVYGGVISAGGLAWLTRLPIHAAYVTTVLLPTIVVAIGFTVMMLPVMAAATARIAHHEAGMASGLLNVSRQVGGALGLAILTTLAGTLARHQHHTTAALATLHGYHAALLGTAIVCLLTTVSASRLRPVPAAAPAADEAAPAAVSEEPAVAARS